MPANGAELLDFITRPPVTAVAAAVSSFICLVLTISWVSTYQTCNKDGEWLSWSEDQPHQACIFNWHPILMVASMIFGTTCAILSYQLPLEKTVTKPLHFVLLFVSFIVLCCGLHAVFKYHDTKKPKPIPNMTSLHSWLGITTVIIFSAQLTAGAYHFLPGPEDGIPGVTAESKALYKPLHVVGGILCVVLPVVCCATGMQEKTEFVDRFGIWKDGVKLKHGDNETGTRFDEFHGSELTHLNFLGLFLLFQVSFVMFAVMRRGAGKKASSELSEGFSAQ